MFVVSKRLIGVIDKRLPSKGQKPWMAFHLAPMYSPKYTIQVNEVILGGISFYFLFHATVNVKVKLNVKESPLVFGIKITPPYDKRQAKRSVNLFIGIHKVIQVYPIHYHQIKYPLSAHCDLTPFLINLWQPQPCMQRGFCYEQSKHVHRCDVLREVSQRYQLSWNLTLENRSTRLHVYLHYFIVCG